MNNDVSVLWSQIVKPAIMDTLYMTILTLIFSTIIALLLSIVLVVTDKNGLKPNVALYRITDTIINIFRSIPFIILAVAITPITRSIVGSSIGRTAAVVPLTIASAPFMARLFESSLKQINASLIDAAKSFGASINQILFRVMFREALPAIILDITVASITILGLTAMAGALGAGGLGAVALTYGYQSFNKTIMIITVTLLVVVTAIIQVLGQVIYNKMK